MISSGSCQEELIFQLANIGGFTAPGKTANSSDTSTTPGSSRSRKWGVARSQKTPGIKHHHQLSPAAHFMGRKTSDVGPTTSEGTWGSSTFSSPRSRSLGLLEVPSRSTSIPNPDFKTMARPCILKNVTSPYHDWKTPSNTGRPPPQYGVKSTPPRVKPFDHPTQGTSKKSYVHEPCCLCLESVSCRSFGEKVVPLDCGHLTHEECITAYLECPTTHDINDLFPICQRCEGSIRCVPSEVELRDKCISQALIRGSPLAKKFSDWDPGSASASKAIQNPSIDSTSTIKNYHFGPTRSASNSKKNVKDLSLQLSPFSSNKSVNRALRGSLLSGISSIVSSVSTRSPAATMSNSQNLLSERVPLAILRSYYSQLLLDNFPESLKAWELDTKFGPLRIVDRLMFSEDGKTYHDACCYLYADALLVALVSPTFDPKNSVGLRLEKFLVQHPLSHVSVDSLNSSVLKCTILSAMNNYKIMQGSTIYLTETLNSDQSQVVEKWISALLNEEMAFKSLNFSSTLPLPLFDTSSSSSRLTVVRTDSKSVDVDFSSDILDTDIIVRHSLADENHNSRRTTITSLLSLKRDRPSNLAIVLQLEISRLKHDELTTAVNSMRALVMKMQETNICIVDQNARIVSQGPAQEQIAILANLSSEMPNSPYPQFTPELFKEISCINMRATVGIAVFSNTSVEEGKSCLFMDFGCFANPKRTRPNELKAHIGYLNFDYMDLVEELVEVSSFNDILETLCYCFNITFDEDDGDCDDDDDHDHDHDHDDDDDHDNENNDDDASEHRYYDYDKNVCTGPRERASELEQSDIPDFVRGNSQVRKPNYSALPNDLPNAGTPQRTKLTGTNLRANPPSPFPQSNGTLCEKREVLSSPSRTTSKTSTSPQSVGSSLYSPTQLSGEELLAEQRATFQSRRSVVRSLQIESPLLLDGTGAMPSEEQDIAQNDGPRWTCFFKGINKALDEAIDFKNDLGSKADLSHFDPSVYEYI
ncbi:LADA_0F03730g1_1 [Lachancea dasiensis]|uniref:LADA_0F03730g1_1 n=1 Tax=Lachancea dasiensis TaxID=1072105 RepID=A0A1G4JIU1_9SACH|nr:LADA_0F03730g1_1 [Lachancea dasiensis]